MHLITFQLVSVVVLGFIVRDSCCIGINSHIEVATRAKEYFEVVSEGVDYNQILEDHEDAFQAGAPYPDAYYPSFCFGGEFNDIAEDSHWTPFINATVNYIRRVYPKPWDEATEKLVVFLLSVVSHQVTDVNWHSIAGVTQGFLTTMGMINYHGSYPDAHSHGDFGADVFNTFSLDMGYIPGLRQWYVPTEDLYNIYYDLYGSERMTTEVIENCTALLFLGRLGESLGVIERLYPFYATRSTFLVDMLQDYFLGGMDDMAVWSSHVWRHTIDMLDYGTEVCDLPRNPVFITCDTLNFYKRRNLAYKKFRDALQIPDYDHESFIDQYEYDEDDILENLDVISKDRGIYLTPTPKLLKTVQEKLKLLYDIIEEDRQNRMSVNATEPSFIYRSSHSYSRFGETLLTGDFNADGYTDLAIGAPLYSVSSNFEQGRVYMIYGTDSGLPRVSEDIEIVSDLSLSGLQPNGRFGSALAVADVNADGIDDLVVSAPSVGSDLLEYHGAVYVYFGQLSGLDTVPGVVTTCQQTYCNFGWSLYGTDIDSDGFKDVVIGSPFAPSGGEQRGAVHFLYSSTQYSGKETMLTETELVQQEGTQDYEWFGYSVTGGNVNNDNWVLVGAPSYRICYLLNCTFNENDVQAAGRVYAYNMSQGIDSYSFTIDGEHNFAQFGFQVTMQSVNSEAKLFVTAATEDVEETIADEFQNITQGGFVHMYNWNEISQNPNADPAMSFFGDRPYGRFGKSIIVEDIDEDGSEDLVISSPLWSDNMVSLTDSGRAFLFNDVNDIEEDTVAASQADAVLGVSEIQMRFGYSAAFIPPTQSSSLLAFGMPYSDAGGRIAGELALYEV